MINISKKVLVKIDSVHKSTELPMADMMPDGNSVAEQAKIEKFKKSSGTLYEYDNVPLPGFTLSKIFNENYGGKKQYWYVLDPRGFRHRISSINLNNILHVTGITGGLIQERCVWVRENESSSMCLLPISDPEYIEAQKNTVLLENKVSMKDVNIGDRVHTKYDICGIYMGTVNLYGNMLSANKNFTNSSLKNVGAYTVSKFLKRQVLKLHNGSYCYQTNLNILSVISKAELPMTLDESIDIMNQDARIGKVFTPYVGVTSYYPASRRICCVSKDKCDKINLTLEEITKDEAKEINREDRQSLIPGRLIVEDDTGCRYMSNFSYFYSGGSHNNLSLSKIKSITTHVETDETECSILHDRTFDDFTRFYKLVKHLKNNTYI